MAAYLHIKNTKDSFSCPYNTWNVLQYMGLSWEYDVIPLLDEKSDMLPEKSSILLSMLESRRESFEETILTAPREVWETQEEAMNYYRKKLSDLKMLLGIAINLNEPIACSL